MDGWRVGWRDREMDGWTDNCFHACIEAWWIDSWMVAVDILPVELIEVWVHQAVYQLNQESLLFLINYNGQKLTEGELVVLRKRYGREWERENTLYKQCCRFCCDWLSFMFIKQSCSLGYYGVFQWDSVGTVHSIWPHPLTSTKLLSIFTGRVE